MQNIRNYIKKLIILKIICKIMKKKINFYCNNYKKLNFIH